jgi:hypothetical protein
MFFFAHGPTPVADPVLADSRLADPGDFDTAVADPVHPQPAVGRSHATDLTDMTKAGWFPIVNL